MLKFFCYLLIFGLINCVCANYNGPFLFWGVDGIKNIKISAMENINEIFLSDFYKEANCVLIFCKSSSERLDATKLPYFKNIIDGNEWAYITQNRLASDPVDYNNNTEMIHLDGSYFQQDAKISSLYENAVLKYGKGKVLGILSNKLNHHQIYKREIESNSSYDYTYYVAGNTILYTTSPIILELSVNNSTAKIHELKTLGSVFSQESKNYSKLVIDFPTDKIKLHFVFTKSPGYWYLKTVEVEVEGKETILSVVGEEPYAITGFSYKCSQMIKFRNETTLLKLKNMQVQPFMNGTIVFAEAFDCVGFVTGTICSVIFVCFILLSALSLAICAILDIKTPNRFESPRSKQLTFNIQD